MKLIPRIIIAANKILSQKYDAEVYRKDYDSYAHTYDSAVTRKLLEKFTEGLVNELSIQPGMRCVDLGCGTGHATEIIARLAGETGTVIGCDVSGAMLEIARNKLKNFLSVRLVTKDMLVFLGEQEKESVDIVTVFWSLGYSEPGRVLKQIKRVLVKDGRVGVIVNNRESLAELQEVVAPVLLKNPFVLKHIPPIRFPAGIKAFQKITAQAELSTITLTENSCQQFFDSGEMFVSWIKTAGACAGLRGALKPGYQEFVYGKIRKIVDDKGGINVTFRFLRYIGAKE